MLARDATCGLRRLLSPAPITGQHRCSALPANIHGLEDWIPCAAMAGSICQRHLTHIKTRYFLNGSAWHRDKWSKLMVAYDGARGVATSAWSLEVMQPFLSTTLLQPIALDATQNRAVVDILVDQVPDTVKIQRLQVICPWLDAAALNTKPTATSRASLAREVLPSIQAVASSMDLQHQFDDEGNVQGHNALSCYRVPKFLQERQRGHLLTAMLFIVAMQVNAPPDISDRAALLASLARMVMALAPIEAAYRNSRSRRHIDAALLGTANEAHALLASSSSLATTPRLLEALQATPLEQEPNIHSLIQRSTFNRSILRRQEAGRNLLAAMEADIDPAIIARLTEIIDTLEASDAAHGEHVIPRNAARFPTFWFGAETSTAPIIKLAQRARARAQGECDMGAPLAADTPINDCWWVAIVCWVRFYKEHRDKDPISGMPMTFHGDVPWCALAPTRVAHVTHNRTFTEEEPTLEHPRATRRSGSSRLAASAFMSAHCLVPPVHRLDVRQNLILLNMYFCL